MDQLEQNQTSMREKVSQVRTKMGQLMETIQVVARGQEVMARIQEETQQRANVVVATHATLVAAATIDPLVPPQGNTTLQIHVSTPCVVPPPVFNPLVIEIDDQYDAFFSPRVGFIYNAFGPLISEVEKKVRAIE